MNFFYKVPRKKLFPIKLGFNNKKYYPIKQKRQSAESKLNKIRANIPFPGWDALEDEKNESRQMIWLNIKDSDGNVISNTKKIKLSKT